MARVHIDVPVPAISLRRPEAAVSLGLSVETFDKFVRHHVPAARVGGVTVYPTDGLRAWAENNATVVADDITKRRAA